jgi:hypothetical protein
MGRVTSANQFAYLLAESCTCANVNASTNRGRWMARELGVQIRPCAAAGGRGLFVCHGAIPPFSERQMYHFRKFLAQRTVSPPQVRAVTGCVGSHYGAACYHGGVAHTSQAHPVHQPAAACARPLEVGFAHAAARRFALLHGSKETKWQ